jgi:cytochrome c553
MKKLLVFLTVLATISFAFYFTACNNKKDESQAESTEDSSNAVLERGEYLVHHVAMCMDCHSKRDFTKYGGPVVPGTEGGGGFVFDQKLGLPGVLYGKNITPDNETGIGTWTDDELKRAITQGINKKGDTLFPLMPYLNFNRMAKEDLNAIVAYIRTLKPIKNAVPARQLMMSIAMVYPGPMLKASVDSNMRPPESDKVAYGGYLANMADCGTCHSPLTPHGPDMTRMFAGGYVFDLGTHKVASANLTPDSTGLGSWNEERFLNKFTIYRDEQNYNYNPGTQNTIMPVAMIAGMTDDDLRAIYAYLRTLPPIKNQVEKFPK